MELIFAYIDPGSGSLVIQALIAGIKQKILTLPDETVVYPGHGGPSTVGAERESNPFLR